LDYLKISATAFKLSRIGLGTWAIGGRMWGGTDEETSIRTIHAAVEQGINFIDTAPAYGFGRSEEIIGKALRENGMRDRVILATKAGIEWSDNRAYRNGTKERIFAEIEDSLRRLSVETIDLYQVHWPDPLVAIEETAEAMRRLYEQGKIRAIGVCNFTVEEIERFRKVAPLHTCQTPFNLFEQKAGRPVLAHDFREGITTLTYGALCRGLLSGRMRSDTTFSGDDLRNIDPKFKPPRYAQYLEAVTRLDSLARKYQKRVIHLALRWILDQEGSGVALWGIRRPDQLEPIEGAFGWSLGAEDMETIEEILRQTVVDPIGPDFMSTRIRPQEPAKSA
jgi:aryl-alcohol dehydrogenase-like predicted oxidoreductase